MITYSHSSHLDNKFKQAIDFFNKLEKDLQYPNCEGRADSIRILEQAQERYLKEVK